MILLCLAQGPWASSLVHLSRRLKCTIVIMRCPSSVRRPSVRPSLTFHIFDFSSETTEQNSTKLDRKQDLNVLYQVCVFRVDRKNKMAAHASDWLRHFRLLLWNRWTEINETWQEARSQRPLPSLCFSGRSVNKNVRLGRFLKKVARTQVHNMWHFGPLVLLFLLFPRIEWSGGGGGYCFCPVCLSVVNFNLHHNFEP